MVIYDALIKTKVYKIKETNKFGQTIVIVTHDPGLASLRDRTCNMQDGLIISA